MTPTLCHIALVAVVVVVMAQHVHSDSLYCQNKETTLSGGLIRKVKSICEPGVGSFTMLKWYTGMIRVIVKCDRIFGAKFTIPVLEGMQCNSRVRNCPSKAKVKDMLQEMFRNGRGYGPGYNSMVNILTFF